MRGYYAGRKRRSCGLLVTRNRELNAVLRRGRRPSGRRFCGVCEVYIYRVRGGKLAAAAGVEDNVARMRQFGLPV